MIHQHFNTKRIKKRRDDALCRHAFPTALHVQKMPTSQAQIEIDFIMCYCDLIEGMLHSSALPAFSENDECQECSFPQLTASCNCVTATCYVNRPAFHHQYLSECLHTEGTTAPSYYTRLIRLYIVTLLEESPELTLHAGHMESLPTNPSEGQCVRADGWAEPNNHRFQLNGLAYWQTRQEKKICARFLKRKKLLLNK